LKVESSQIGWSHNGTAIIRLRGTGARERFPSRVVDGARIARPEMAEDHRRHAGGLRHPGYVADVASGSVLRQSTLQRRQPTSPAPR